MKSWQQYLKRIDFFEGQPQGNFGTLTKQATANYQTAMQLPVTGVWDEETLQTAKEGGYTPSALEEDCCAGITVTYSTERFPQTRRGPMGNDALRKLSDSDLRWAINEI